MKQRKKMCIIMQMGETKRLISPIGSEFKAGFPVKIRRT